MVGIVPVIYYYLNPLASLMADNVELGTFGAVALNGRDLIGAGFWVSMVAALAILILPFIALLLPHPSVQSE